MNLSSNSVLNDSSQSQLQTVSYREMLQRQVRSQHRELFQSQGRDTTMYVTLVLNTLLHIHPYTQGISFHACIVHGRLKKRQEFRYLYIIIVTTRLLASVRGYDLFGFSLHFDTLSSLETIFSFLLLRSIMQNGFLMPSDAF